MVISPCNLAPDSIRHAVGAVVISSSYFAFTPLPRLCHGGCIYSNRPCTLVCTVELPFPCTCTVLFSCLSLAASALPWTALLALFLGCGYPFFENPPDSEDTGPRPTWGRKSLRGAADKGMPMTQSCNSRLLSAGSIGKGELRA